MLHLKYSLYLSDLKDVDRAFQVICIFHSFPNHNHILHILFHTIISIQLTPQQFVIHLLAKHYTLHYQVFFQLIQSLIGVHQNRLKWKKRLKVSLM